MRAARGMLIAAVSASLCMLAPLLGAASLLAAGIMALILLARRGSLDQGGFSEFGPWLLGTVTFCLTALAFSPWLKFAAVPIVLCLLSPLFGTMIYLVERAVVVGFGNVD